MVMKPSMVLDLTTLDSLQLINILWEEIVYVSTAMLCDLRKNTVEAWYPGAQLIDFYEEASKL